MGANQQHISADIAVAVENYYRATGDSAWMQLEGCELIREIASFVASRVTWNRSTDKYEVRGIHRVSNFPSITGDLIRFLTGVMGPDEDHGLVDNNFYTNLAFQRVLRFAR